TPIDVKNFSISERDYADFVAMAMERDIPYKSESRVALEKLRSALKKERNDSLEEALSAIDKGLNDDKRSCFETFRDDIEEQINQNIVLRYAYAEGVIASSLRSDKELKVAIEILADKVEYERILTSQDTARK
ncbi:MAG: peptidase, partial [Alistipes sp.]|nr:peptidase [Alistipes sp.]